jgi:hypothetical protein
MPSRNVSLRSEAWLQTEAPISDDANLLKLKEQAAEYLRLAKRHDLSVSEELGASVVDAVARDYFRYALRNRRKGARVLPILLVLSAITLFATPAIAQTPYDGLWKVNVVTKTGSCQPITSYPLVVADGKVSGADVSGRVGNNGIVKVSLSGAFAVGQLSGNVGSGKWNAASVGTPCSGRWMATRQ